MLVRTNTARMFAALSATNEAILYAKSPDELYQQVCEAAFSSGDFLVTAILLLDPATSTSSLHATSITLKKTEHNHLPSVDRTIEHFDLLLKSFFSFADTTPHG